MTTKKTPLLLLLATLAIAGVPAAAGAQTAVSCAPLVTAKVVQAPYAALSAQLTAARLASFKTRLDAVTNQATYAQLYAAATTVAATVANGRIVITLTDGTVVVDTGKGAANTFADFAAKSINENHNSRLSILDAQLFECGIGLETKRSTTTGVIDDAVAKRLGSYLASSGTVRLSKPQ